MSDAAYPVAATGKVRSSAAAGIPAPHARRVVAWVVDLGVVFVVLALQPWWNVALVLALFVAYHAVSLWLVGQTLGKALLGLRVERIGRVPTLLWALGRTGVGYLGVDLLGLGLVPALRDPQRRCAHDIVFGSRVVVADESTGMQARLAAFAERHREALELRKRLFAALAAFLAWALGLGELIRRALDAITPGSPPAHATAPLKALSAKAAAVAAAGTTAVMGLAVAEVPPVAGVVDWLLEPRSVWIDRAPVEAIAGEWRVDRLRQVERVGWRPGDLLGTDWAVVERDGRFVLIRSRREMRLRGERDGSYVASWTGPGRCAGSVEGRVRSTFRLRPIEGTRGRPVKLDVTLEEIVTAPDSAEARRHRCPVEASTVYRGIAGRRS